MKIKYKLMLAMLGMMLILFVFNGYSMLNTTYSEMLQEKTVVFAELVSQTLRSFETVSDNIEYGFFDFFRTEGVGNILWQVKTPGQKDAQLRMKLTTLKTTQGTYVEEACIVDLEGEFCFPLRWPENEKEAFRNAFAALPLDNDVQWYADEQGNLFLCRTIYTLVPYEPQGYLLGRLDVPHLRSLTGMDSMQDGMVTVLDRKGRQLFTGRDETEAPVALFAPDTPKGEWICVQDHDEKVWSLAMTTRRGEWNICFAIPEKDMMARYYRIQKNLFITYGVLIVMGALLALIFSKSMTRNISHLMNSINHIHKSGIKGPVSVEVNGHDEIAELAQKYNWLLSYINSIHQAEYDLLELKYRFIQSQISPHFISNILSSITSYSFMGDTDKMESLCIKTSKYLKNNLVVSDQRFIPMRKEINNVHEYVEIYRLTSAMNVEFTSSCPPEAEKLNILSMLLQPLVENALLHAMNCEADHCFIVEVEVAINSERPYVTVRDNGCGIDQEVVCRVEKIKSEVNSVIQESSGFGIGAVIRRLSLQYGNDYTFDIHCPPEGGTEIVISFPNSGEYDDQDKDDAMKSVS